MTPSPSGSSPPRPPTGTGPRTADRAVSDVIGFVLVFSLVVAVVGIVSLAGMSSLESARSVEQTNNAERAMEVLADNMADIHTRGAPSRATEISLEDASLYLGDTVLIEVRDPGDGPGDDTFLETSTFNVRPIVYDDGDTELVYVMGAILRQGPDGGTVVQPWSPTLDRERTLINVVDTASSTGGPQSIRSDTVLVRAGYNSRQVHVVDTDATYDDVWINVTSPRHELWERMLGDHPRISCPSPDPDPDEVQCTLDYEPETLYVVSNRIAVTIER